MLNLFDKITEWITAFLIEGIMSALAGLFDGVNTRVGEIAFQVGQTPQGWNSGVFSMVRNLSETVIIPIAGIILTFILCYELINMIVEKNNLHDIDTWMFFKWIFKTFVAVYLVTHTFDIIMAVFALGQNVVSASAGAINGNANIDIASVMTDFETQMKTMTIGPLLGLWFQSIIVQWTMEALSICIFIVCYGRMLEIYMMSSIGPIPFATMVNRDWGTMGQNYLKSLFALAFQAFLIMICVAIYAALVQTISLGTDVSSAIWTCLAYTVLLCFTLFKTGSLSKSVFNTH